MFEPAPNQTSNTMVESSLSDSVPIAADVLREWAAAALGCRGLDDEHAALVAGCLVQTSLWGVDTHGIARLPHYLDRLGRGSIEARPALSFEKTGAATGSVDGGHGLGMVVCNFAMDHAIALAGEAGAGVVGCYRSSHCGAIGLYCRQAARAGMIGIAFTHSDAFVTPHNGRAAFLGTNPICIAVPSADGPPVCLDMATSTIPFNRVMNARRDGETLPDGVAVDDQGETTTDPNAATALLPFAGHKGYVLGFMIDVLCGLVNGMDFGPHLTPMYDRLDERRNLGSLMIAIDPSRFAGGPTLAAEVARMAAEVRAAPARPGTDVMAPGDMEIRSEQARGAHGIPVEAGLAAQIREWSRTLGIAEPPELAAG